MPIVLLAAAAHKIVPPLLFAGIILFIVYLFRRRKRFERGVADFRQRRGLRGLGPLSAEWRAALGAGHWAGWSGTLTTKSGPIPYLWFEGFQSINRAIHPFVAVVIPAALVTEGFKARTEQAKKSASWWREAFLRDAQAPSRLEPVGADRFLVAWTVCINPDHYEKALNWLERTIEADAATLPLAPAG